MKESQLMLCTPETSSAIRVKFRTGPSSKGEYHPILVISYSGVYGIGSKGNGDAHYMHAMGTFGMEFSNAAGLILDFRKLNYKWGDMMDYVLNLPHEARPRPIPFAIIFGEKNRKALGTLFFGTKSRKSPTRKEWAFDTFEEAWKWVDERIA